MMRKLRKTESGGYPFFYVDGTIVTNCTEYALKHGNLDNNKWNNAAVPLSPSIDPYKAWDP